MPNTLIAGGNPLRRYIATAVESDPRGRMVFVSFPEPFLHGQERFHRRWSREYAERLIYDDLRSLEHVREVSLLDAEHQLTVS